MTDTVTEHEREAQRIVRWKFDPVAFVREVFRAEPDEWQKDVLMALATPEPTVRVCMSASKGPGKSCCMAWACWWHQVTHFCSQIICTSISGDNLKDNLWKELGSWLAHSRYLQYFFDFKGERVSSKSRPIDWWISARSWAKNADLTQQADTLAGFHGPNVMFIGDEAGSYPPGIMPAAEACLANAIPGSGKTAKILIGGNPTDVNGPLYEAAVKHRRLWKVVRINGDPDNPKRSPRISIEWAREQIEKYGRDNPYVLVNVFGEFPPSGFNTLLGPDDIHRATLRNYTDIEYGNAQKRLGVDCARYGDDATVIYFRQGLIAGPYVEMRGARTDEIAARVAVAKERTGAEVVFVDGTGGYGAGVVDALIQAGHTPIEVNFSGKPTDPRYFNKRSEMWYEMAEWIKNRGQIPADDLTLARELPSPTYTFHKGKILLEEKAIIKSRLGFSTDHSDALALTFALPEMPSARPSYAARAYRSGPPGDFDPISNDRLIAGRGVHGDYDPMDSRRM